MVSRVFGFIRDAMILALLGTGPLYEAFVVAFRLPNMVRRLFVEGAFNVAFVPLFSKKLHSGEDAIGFAREAFSGMAAVLIVITLFAQAIMPWLIWGVASGFAGQDEFELTVSFGRIMFPYVLFISLAALLSGVLNASGRFAAAAAAPVLLNVFLIGGLLIAIFFEWDITRVLVWMIPISGMAQLLLVSISATRAGFTMKIVRPRLTPELKRLIRISVPAALAGGVVQVNMLVGQQVASYFDRAVGWLFAADRLYQLPLGVVGIAIGVVLLPDLSRRVREGDHEGSREAFSRAGEIALTLTIPSAVALVVIPLSLVSVLFERGAMTSDDSAAIAVAVAIYGLGLPAFVLQKILQPLFFAREDTKQPFYYAIFSMAVNATLAFGLAPVIGWVAPAVATTIAGWTMVVLLLLGARSRLDGTLFNNRFYGRFWRVCTASGIMGLVLFVVQLMLSTMLVMTNWRYLALVLLVGVGLSSYFLAGTLLGAFRPRELQMSLQDRGYR